MSKIIPRKRFRVLASGGAGRAEDASAQCMAFFRGALYLGTAGANLAASGDPPRILRLSEPTGGWEAVYQSPLVEPTARSSVPDRRIVGHIQNGAAADLEQRLVDGKVARDVGYRSMCVFQGASDPEPALYVSSMSRAGGVLLRSRNGGIFEQVGEAGFGNPDAYSLAGLTAFGGRLFAVPAGTVSNDSVDPILPPEAKIYVSADPAAEGWREASETAFGDPRNVGITALGVAHSHLYAGTINPERGFQLWRTEAAGEPPYNWELVASDGAGAFNHNLIATAMTEFNGALYVGSGITGFGYDVVDDVGPASAELMRVHPDGSWDLIAGRMRFTEDGLKVPLSLLGPGLGDLYNSAVGALAVHDGALYLGTHQWEAVRGLDTDAEQLVGGYQLWASDNGEDWQVVVDDGGGNPAALGVTALASTPIGLFAGTHNQSEFLRLLGRMRNRADLDFEDGFAVLYGK